MISNLRLALARPMGSLSSSPPLLLTPEQYLRLHSSASVVPLDASWHMPAGKTDPLNEFRTRRLPRARFLDLDLVADLSHPLHLPHMMPSPQTFAGYCEKVGISRNSHVVLYDSQGLFSSPRALFMFKAFGHERASLLNGGLPAWISLGYPTENGSAPPLSPTRYPVPELDTTMLRGYDQMIINATKDFGLGTKAELVVDARSSGRFEGSAPEPRAGMSSGHIPNSLNIPFDLLRDFQLDSEGRPYTTLKSRERLRELFVRALGTEEQWISRQIVSTCGSGMTAAIIWLAFQHLGIDSAVYDESWMGWASRKSPIVKA